MKKYTLQDFKEKKVAIHNNVRNRIDSKKMLKAIFGYCGYKRDFNGDGDYYEYIGDESFKCGSFTKMPSIPITELYNQIPMEKNYTITADQAQEIFDIACSDWKQTLYERWGLSMLKNEAIEVDSDFYDRMRGACTAFQHALFDKIFGPVSKEIDLKDPSTFNNLKIYEEEGSNSLIGICELNNSRFWLNPRYNWEITNGRLIPTKK